MLNLRRARSRRHKRHAWTAHQRDLQKIKCQAPSGHLERPVLRLGRLPDQLCHVDHELSVSRVCLARPGQVSGSPT
jgi:hypothetical protein